MNNLNKKKSLYFVVGLIVLIAGYNTIMNYKTVQETNRHRNYVEGIQTKLTTKDSLDIIAFYQKLCVINNTLSSDTLESQVFSNINKSQIPKDFQPHICTKDYLDFICNSHLKQNLVTDSRNAELLDYIDAYLGLGTFNRNIKNKQWDGSVKSEIGVLKKSQFLMVVDLSEIILPVFHDNTDVYDAGYCKGRVNIVNLKNGNIEASTSFFAQNDKSITSVRVVKQAMEDKLLKNLLENIHQALNKSSQTIFDRPLKTKDAEYYE